MNFSDTDSLGDDKDLHIEFKKQFEAKKKQYEQDLWEQVVIAWIGGAASDPTTRNWKINAKEFIGTAACVADAFMAERAKRMKK